MNKEKMHDKIKGALFGVAVGDALGGPLEFMSAEEIRKKHGRVTEMIGGGWLDLKPGETTDDTAMTLCVAEGILEKPLYPYPAIGYRFIEWYCSGPKDIGSTCMSSIYHAINNGEDWHKAALTTQIVHGKPSEGNGALMRTIYPALYYASYYDRTRFTEGIAQMTHAGKQSTRLCTEYVEQVHAAILGDWEEFCRHMPASATSEPTGYVVDSYNVAMDTIGQTSTFKDALVEAVNKGGDADTIGAICGGLAGAIYGYDQIPKSWIEKLDPQLQKDLNRLADAACDQYE